MNVMLIVDCQNDFMDKFNGLLYVPGAEEIKPNIVKLINKIPKNTKMLFTLDSHILIDEELSNSPDFNKTFPPHCIIGSWGWKIIQDIKYDENNSKFFRKNKFSVFEGNKDFGNYIMNLSCKLKNEDLNVYCFGVAGDVCLFHAVNGLIECSSISNNIKIKIIKDCVAHFYQ